MINVRGDCVNLVHTFTRHFVFASSTAAISVGASPLDIKTALLNLAFLDGSAETVLDVTQDELPRGNAWTFTIGFQSLGKTRAATPGRSPSASSRSVRR